MFNDKKIESLFEGKGDGLQAGTDAELHALFAELKNLRDDVPAMQFGPEHLKNAILNRPVSETPRRNSALWSRAATVAACGLAVFLIARGINNPTEMTVTDSNSVALIQASEPEFSPAPEWWQESEFSPAEATVPAVVPTVKAPPKAIAERQSPVRTAPRTKRANTRVNIPVQAPPPAALATKSSARSAEAAPPMKVSMADVTPESVNGETAVVVTGRSDQQSGARNAIEVKNLDELVLGS